MVDSQTKYFYELTPERILDAVDAGGLKTTGRCLQLNSMENRVYEVEVDIDDVSLPPTASQRFRVVKFYRPGRWNKQQILEEHQYLLDALEYELTVVAPERFSDDSTLQQLPDAEIFYAMFPKQGGRICPELDDEQLEQIGRLVARLHNVGQTKAAEHRLQLSPATYGIDNLEYLIESNSLPENMEGYYADTVRRICEISEPWFDETRVQRIHGDCHLGNILWGSHGPSLVDFDDMVTGPCVQDLWLLVPGRDPEDRQRRDVLLEAYEQMRDFDRSSLRLIEPLRALRMVHFSAWIARRYSDPAFSRTFPDFGSDRYWRDELQSLLEIVEIIQTESAW